MGGGGATKNAMNKASSLTDQQLADQKAALGSAGKTEDYYQGDGGGPQSSGLYKSLLTTGLESTSDAYQGAKAATKANEAKAGYGYASPASEGADREVNAAEAHDLAQQPNKALIAATGPQLQATGMKQAQAGYYQPATYFGDQANLATQYDNQKSALWKSLAGIGENAAMAFI